MCRSDFCRCRTAPAGFSYAINFYDGDIGLGGFTGEDITAGSMVISKTAASSSVTAGAISVTQFTAEVPYFNPPTGVRAEVTATRNGRTLLSAVYYVTAREHTGSRLRITAQDCLSKLDVPFEYTLAEGTTSVDLYDAVCRVTEITGIEFWGSQYCAGYVFPSVPTGRCRDIISQAAAACGANVIAVGAASAEFIDSTNAGLAAIPATAHAKIDKVSPAAPQVYQAIVSSSSVSICTGNLQLTEEETAQLNADGIYYSPMGFGYPNRSTVTAVCGAASQAMADAVAAKVTAWNPGCGYRCTAALVDCDIRLYTRVIFGERPDDVFRAENVRLRLCSDGIYAELSAEEKNVRDAEYSSKYQRQLDGKLEAGKPYASVSTDGSAGYQSGVSLGSGGLTFWREEIEDGTL